jgi:hypothetical protein
MIGIPPNLLAQLGSNTPPRVPPDILNSVLSGTPGFSRVYKPEDIKVVFASPERLKQLKASGGSDRQLEFWPPTEEGSPGFPRPGEQGKYVLEIYNPELMKNPEALKQAIYGDLLHGMTKDPYWAGLRKQFGENWNPQIAAFNQQLLKRPGWNNDSILDMYIRGRLASGQGDEWKENSRYSPAQLQILDQMKNYLSTGQVPKVSK